MTSYVDIFHADYEGFRSLTDRISAWWDLGAVDAEYVEFIDRFADSHSRWKASKNAARTAFQIYIPMLTQWRRLPYLDPGLPTELLPKSWSGNKAGDLFHDLDALLRVSAREHAMSTVHG